MTKGTIHPVLAFEGMRSPVRGGWSDIMVGDTAINVGRAAGLRKDAFATTRASFATTLASRMRPASKAPTVSQGPGAKVDAVEPEDVEGGVVQMPLTRHETLELGISRVHRDHFTVEDRASDPEHGEHVPGKACEPLERQPLFSS